MQLICCRSIIKVFLALSGKGPVLWSFIGTVGECVILTLFACFSLNWLTSSKKGLWNRHLVSERKLFPLFNIFFQNPLLNHLGIVFNSCFGWQHVLWSRAGECIFVIICLNVTLRFLLWRTVVRKSFYKKCAKICSIFFQLPLWSFTRSRVSVIY